MTEMLQKTENVAKNVANENSQDLTSQWKKRTLRNGAYYIKMLDGDILPAFCNTEYILKQFQTMKGIYDNVAEVLAPVPTFEEWKELKEYERIVTSYNMKPIDYDIACETVNKLLDERKALKEQNAKLKEVLKECVKMNTRLENALWQWNEESKLYDENEALENKINEVLK